MRFKAISAYVGILDVQCLSLSEGGKGVLFLSAVPTLYIFVFTRCGLRGINSTKQHVILSLEMERQYRFHSCSVNRKREENIKSLLVSSYQQPECKKRKKLVFVTSSNISVYQVTVQNIKGLL